MEKKTVKKVIKKTDKPVESKKAIKKKPSPKEVAAPQAIRKKTTLKSAGSGKTSQTLKAKPAAATSSESSAAQSAAGAARSPQSQFKMPSVSKTPPKGSRAAKSAQPVRESIQEQVSTPQPAVPATDALQPAPASFKIRTYWQDRYSDDRMVLMVRDPYWCFVYWDLSPGKQAEINNGLSSYAAQLVLRIYDVTEIDFNGANAHRSLDIDIGPEADNWYINVWETNRAYCVDLGLRYPDGRFVTLLRSNVVTTPRETFSPIVDEEWMVVDETFDRLYQQAGAGEVGRSSEAIAKYMLKRVHIDASSGGLASMGSQGGRPRFSAPEDFWLVVNTELIVYGATESDAQVTIQDQEVKLNADGTFSVRYALPDGKQTIPVKAINASGTQTRQITPIVEKRTE